MTAQNRDLITFGKFLGWAHQHRIQSRYAKLSRNNHDHRYHRSGIFIALQYAADMRRAIMEDALLSARK